MSMPHFTSESLIQPPASRRYAWSVFAILLALMVFDYTDRQVVVSMFPHLKAQWSLSDTQLGALASIVSITVALAGVPVALLADRWSRVKSIFVMALVWSVATVVCAVAESYWHLLGARAVIGLGEAGYGSVGAALLATLFPTRMRSTILGIFIAAGMLGSLLGVMLGGYIADHWGWQAGFGAVGVPGLIVALLFPFVARDYKTVSLPSKADADGKSALAIRGVIAELLRPRSALIACVAAGLQLLAVSTLWAWLPSYFNRYYGLAPQQAGLKAAVIVLMSGIGSMFWSYIADRLYSSTPKARLYVPLAASALTAVFMTSAFALCEPGAVQFALIIAGGLVMVGGVGPVAAAVTDVIHPALRSTAMSVLSLTQNLFGLAGGPLLTGALSDVYGLPFAMAVVPVFCVFAAVLFLLAARTYEADRDKVEGSEPAVLNTNLSPQAA
jgi:predicted MFS family arabinose efflux permease